MTAPSHGSAIPAAAESTAVVGIDAGTRTEREAEHLALQLIDALQTEGLTVTWALTHRVVVDGVPRVALSLTGPSGLVTALARIDPELVTWSDGSAAEGGAAAAAARANLLRSEGRAVRFPGLVDLVGSVCVVDVLEKSAVERIALLGGGNVDPRTVVHTRDFVRPRLVDGELVLHVQPARGGALVPFETPNPTPCCADH